MKSYNYLLGLVLLKISRLLHENVSGMQHINIKTDFGWDSLDDSENNFEEPCVGVLAIFSFNAK